jgi:modification methylase
MARSAMRRSCAPTALWPAGDHEGSIHKVGALVEAREACNGWTFWHAKRDGVLVSIDDYRTEIRKKAV